MRARESADIMTGDKLTDYVARQYADLETWREVGKHFVSEAAKNGENSWYSAANYGSIANAVYRGRIKDSPTLRRALGWPLKEVTVETCPDCGEVHEQLHTCPDELQKRRSRPTRYRLHYEAGYGPEGKAQREQIEDEMEWADCESFTEYVDYLRGWRSDLVSLSELTEAER